MPLRLQALQTFEFNHPNGMSKNGIGCDREVPFKETGSFSRFKSTKSKTKNFWDLPREKSWLQCGCVNCHVSRAITLWKFMSMVDNERII